MSNATRFKFRVWASTLINFSWQWFLLLPSRSHIYVDWILTSFTIYIYILIFCPFLIYICTCPHPSVSFNPHWIMTRSQCNHRDGDEKARKLQSFVFNCCGIKRYEFHSQKKIFVKNICCLLKSLIEDQAQKAEERPFFPASITKDPLRLRQDWCKTENWARLLVLAKKITN